MMRRRSIVEIIKESRQRPLPDIVDRTLKVRIPRSGRAVTIIGPRRAGKTYFLYQQIRRLREEGTAGGVLYVNLEDDRLLNVQLKDMDMLLRTFREVEPGSASEKTYLFLDEVQVVEGWERYVRRVMDKEDVQVFLTGSSSRLLAKEVATMMRGRSLTYTILPFGFGEFLEARGVAFGDHLSPGDRSRMLAYLREFMTYGGFPEVVLEDAEDSKLRILRELVDVMLMRDVIERHGLRNILALRTLLSRLISSMGTEFSINKLAGSLRSQGIKVSKNTLYDYFGHLEDVFAILPVRRFSYKLREIHQSLPKVYPVDTGLVTQSEGRFSDDLGRFMEGVVAIELHRRRAADPLMEVYYWKDDHGKEVDFVIKEGKRVTRLIQVCYDLEALDTRDREVKALLKSSMALGCKDLTIITWDTEEETLIDGRTIEAVPLWKWLTGRRR
jgi:predicted AAA+ superfamily ATPase